MNYLGFDTSNYTTSAAVCTDNEIKSARRLLTVKQGERGLRQSDALFQHVKQLPDIVKELGTLENIAAVGVSTRPRTVEGSYMPVFLAGISVAETAAAVLGVPLYEFSHQDGHIMAGIHSAAAYTLLKEEFISVHLSGGTTELVKTAFNGKGFSTEIIGGTKDISAGQVIDRTGVNLGMKFPCGAALDRLSQTADKGVRLPVSVDGGYFNFSGLETKAATIKCDKAELAKGVFETVAKTLVAALEFCSKEYNIKKILFVGGVASNSLIRERIFSAFGENVYFATPDMSTDNACGISILTKTVHEGVRK